MRTKKRFVFRAAMLVLFAFCWNLSSTEAQKPEKLKVFVSILPQAYFVERIGGDHVDVGVLVAPGQDAHTFEPTPKTLTELSRARAFFGIGLPFESALTRKLIPTFKDLQVVDTTIGIQLRSFQEAERHGHGKEKHGHGEFRRAEADPHVWMDPKLVKIQSAAIAETLKQIDPERADDYAAGLKSLQADLDGLDAELRDAISPFKGMKFFVYHPAFGYLGDAYGLEQVPVEIEGKEPSARHLAQIIREAKNNQVRIIFVQPQFSGKGAEAIAREIGGAVVPLDPLARDYLANMRKIADDIKKSLDVQTNRTPMVK